MNAAETEHARDVSAHIARALQDEAEKLRHAFDAAVRRWVSVEFTGPVAELFAIRMEERMHRVNSVLTKMGAMADELLAASRGHSGGHHGSTGHGGGSGSHGSGHGGSGGGSGGSGDGSGSHGSGHGGTGGGSGGHGGHGGTGGPQGVRRDDKGGSTGGALDGGKLPSQYRRWLPYVEQAAKKYHVDPALILAIMDRETGDPHRVGHGGRNIIGDGGHGHGLMQIDDGSHGAWLRGHHNGLDPESNIAYGTSILAANIRQFPGNLKAAVAAYNGGAGGVSRAMSRGLSPDAATTGHNYGSDVLRRRDHFARLLRD